MGRWLPWRYGVTPDNRGVGRSNMPFEMVVGNPLYSLPDAYFVRASIRTHQPNTAYTSQAVSDVTINPNSQGFAGVLALQELLNLQSGGSSG